MKEIKLGIIGTNFISDWMVAAVKETDGITVHAVYSRKDESAKKFAEKHSIPNTFTDYEAFLASDIDAVYVASPNFLHYEQSKKAAEHKKHVIVEKPACLNTAEFDDLIKTADENEVIVLEAMRPAHDPAIEQVRTLLPEIGTIRRATFDFCQYSSRYDKFKAGEILNAFNPSLGNAAVMDIGVYAVEACAILFGEPDSVYAKSVILDNGMEGMGTIFCDYKTMQAEIVYSKIADSANPSVIMGEDGDIKINRISIFESVSMKKRGQSEQIILKDRFPEPHGNMIYECRDFRDLINGTLSRDAYEKFTSYTKATLKIIDEARRQNNIKFPTEKI